MVESDGCYFESNGIYFLMALLLVMFITWVIWMFRPFCRCRTLQKLKQEFPKKTLTNGIEVEVALENLTFSNV